MNQTLTSNIANQGQQFGQQLLPLLGQFGWGALVWALLFMMLAIVLAMIIFVVISKKGYLQRHTLLWNVASKLSYVVILLGLPLLGASLGLLYGAQRQIPPLLEAQVQPLVAAQMPGLRAYIALQVKNVPLDKVVNVKDLAASMLLQYAYQPKSDSFLERQKANLINRILINGGTSVLSEALEQILARQVEAVGNSLAEGYFDANASKAVAKVSIETLRQLASGDSAGLKTLDKSLPGLVMKAIESKINAWFLGMYTMFGMLTLVLALLIGAEIVIYRRFFRPVGLKAKL